MKADDIIFYACTNGKIEWWFKLTWGDGHGGMGALRPDEEFKRMGFCRNNLTNIDLADYDISFKIVNQEV